MTKVIKLLVGGGGITDPETELKPIKFLWECTGWPKLGKAVGRFPFWEETVLEPCNYDYVELVTPKFMTVAMCDRLDQDMDLMFAYHKDDGREQGILYLGNFNDGVVQ